MGYVPSHPCVSASPLLSSHHVLLKGSALSSAGRTRLQTSRGCPGWRAAPAWYVAARRAQQEGALTAHVPLASMRAVNPVSTTIFTRTMSPSSPHPTATTPLAPCPSAGRHPRQPDPQGSPRSSLSQAPHRPAAERFLGRPARDTALCPRPQQRGAGRRPCSATTAWTGLKRMIRSHLSRAATEEATWT